MNELELVITKNEAAVFESNIADLEVYVDKRLKEYNPATYKGDADAAKSARAELNAAKKQLAARRIALTKERESKDPFTQGMNRIHALEKRIDEVSSALDAIVKEKEAAERKGRYESVKFMWGKQGFDYADFDKVLARFGKKWLNKTMKSVEMPNEMTAAIATMESELKAIEKFHDDTEEVKAYYLNCLDLIAASNFGEERIEGRKRAAQEKAEREEREKERALSEQSRAAHQEQRQIERQADMKETLAIANAAQGIECMDEAKEADCEYVVTVKCKPSEVPLVKAALTASRIVFTSFEKLEF